MVSYSTIYEKNDAATILTDTCYPQAYLKEKMVLFIFAEQVLHVYSV